MDAPVVGKRRVNVESVSQLQAHPEDVCVVSFLYAVIHPGTPPFVRVFTPKVYHNMANFGETSHIYKILQHGIMPLQPFGRERPSSTGSLSTLTTEVLSNGSIVALFH